MAKTSAVFGDIHYRKTKISPKNIPKFRLSALSDASFHSSYDVIIFNFKILCSNRAMRFLHILYISCVCLCICVTCNVCSHNSALKINITFACLIPFSFQTVDVTQSVFQFSKSHDTKEDETLFILQRHVAFANSVAFAVE